MIEFTSGDILQSDAEALVNTVNCVGVMGRGIALQFKKAYPENFKRYKAACDREEVRPGEMFVHDLGALATPRWIVNFPTKRHWRAHSRMEDVESGLKALRSFLEKHEVRSVAVPPLGCGLGGLDWSGVRERIEQALGDLEGVRVSVYEPKGAPAPSKMVRSEKAPRMTAARAILLELMNRYRAGLMDPFVTLLEIHKLTYFMQEAGQPLKLNYQKAPYGPYAENLRHVLNAIEGHFIEGYGDGADKPDTQIETKPEAMPLAEKLLANGQSERERFERVADLIDGFETPFGMELLSTVHWVCTRENATTLEACVHAVHAWGERKQMFLPAHIEIAWRMLREKGWLPVAPVSAA